MQPQATDTNTAAATKPESAKPTIPARASLAARLMRSPYAFPLAGFVAVCLVMIFTTEQADPRRVRELEAQAGQVIAAGEQTVTGDRLVQAMAGLGYRAIYSASGPKVLHLLLAAGVLDRLYLTLASRLLGGEPYSTIVEGPLLAPAAGMRLQTAYLDDDGLDGLGQLFLAYRRAG